LMIHRLKDARKDFERAIKLDKRYADAYNNLGVVYYADKNAGKAIKQYKKAIELHADVAPFHNNLGAAYFQKKDFDKAVQSYSEALRLDPSIFERTSRAGVLAQLPSPDDRAHYDYVLAKLFAKMGVADRSLEYLRKAMEEGYKEIGNVYKDAEFAELRKDPRFTELMSSKPTAISD
jgi:tetratricopeptide (TPR) repeat protein